jgi:hypothetical protein
MNQPASPTEPTRRAKIFFCLKLLYAVCSGLLCVWLASFMPAEGPPIAALIPPSATATFLVRDGAALLRDASENQTVLDLLNDLDVETLYGLKARREMLLAKYQKLPAPARWLFPATLDSLVPLIGKDAAVASLAPDEPQGLADERAASRPLLAFTRVSGARGLLIRLGLRFAPPQKQMRLFDLGGGLIAVGFDGAAPAWNAQATDKVSTAVPAALPVARLSLRPQAFKTAAEKKGLSVRVAPQLDLLRAEGVPGEVLKALQRPPALAEIFGAKELPESVDVDIFQNAAGGFAVRGTLIGELPSPKIAPKPADASVFDEMFLPLNAENAFLRYLEGEMRLQGAAPTLSKGQRRWSRRLSNLEEREVDLHGQLWPAFGSALYLTVQDPPSDINTVAYGVIKACLPFDGKRDRARYAAGELAREKWEDLFDGPAPKSVKPPFVRRVKGAGFERYVLMTGQINAPSWTISDNLFCFTSDAGPFAVRDAGGEPPQAPWKAAPAPAYFVRLDGPRSATTAEALADVWFSTKEDALGAHEFLEQYPNAELQIKLVRKLTRLLGKISLEITPDPQKHSAVIDGIWVPGKFAVPEEKQEDSVPPPPPALN